MTSTSITMYETAGSGFRTMPFLSSRLVTTNQYVVPGESRFPADWRNVVVARLAELERLAPNWDGAGGWPVARRHANRAFAFMDLMVSDGPVAVPEIVPLADGGVQLEWHLTPDRRVDFVSDEDSEPVVLLQDGEVLTEAAARVVDLASLRAFLEAE